MSRDRVLTSIFALKGCRGSPPFCCRHVLFFFFSLSLSLTQYTRGYSHHPTRVVPSLHGSSAVSSMLLSHLPAIYPSAISSRSSKGEHWALATERPAATTSDRPHSHTRLSPRVANAFFINPASTACRLLKENKRVLARLSLPPSSTHPPHLYPAPCTQKVECWFLVHMVSAE